MKVGQSSCTMGKSGRNRKDVRELWLKSTLVISLGVLWVNPLVSEVSRFPWFYWNPDT